MIFKFIVFSFLCVFHFNFAESAASGDQDAPAKVGIRTYLEKDKKPRIAIDPHNENLAFLKKRGERPLSSEAIRRNVPHKIEASAIFHAKKLPESSSVHRDEELEATVDDLDLLRRANRMHSGFFRKIDHRRDRGYSAPPSVDAALQEEGRAASPVLMDDGLLVRQFGRELSENGLAPENYVIEAPHKIISREDALLPPYSSVVKLEMVLLGEDDVPLRTYLGSGVLIGGRYVLTAAHNLFFRQYETGPSGIRVFPGQSGPHIFHETQASQFIIHPSYLLKEGELYKEFDVGLIVLEHSIGDTVGWLPYMTLGPDILLKSPLKVVGYPSMMHKESEEEGGNPSFELLQGHTMYEMLGMSTRLTEHQIFYLINTYKGHSGGPILRLEPDGKHVICGVHTYGGDTKDGNCGTWISPYLYRLIGQWIEEFTAVEAVTE